MKIKTSTLPSTLLHQINNPDPLDGEDILIEDNNGKIIGVIIQPSPYDFLLEKIEERENKIDSQLDEPYDPKSKTLTELLKNSEND